MVRLRAERSQVFPWSLSLLSMPDAAGRIGSAQLFAERNPPSPGLSCDPRCLKGTHHVATFSLARLHAGIAGNNCDALADQFPGEWV
jgi:hypothetical protein